MNDIRRTVYRTSIMADSLDVACSLSVCLFVCLSLRISVCLSVLLSLPLCHFFSFTHFISLLLLLASPYISQIIFFLCLYLSRSLAVSHYLCGYRFISVSVSVFVSVSVSVSLSLSLS